MTDTTPTDTPTDMDAADIKALLMSRRTVETEDVPLHGLGISVTVRGMSRKEALALKGKPMSQLESEQKLLALAMVSPRMTEEEVRTWQKMAPAGELEPISGAILRLSGMGATVVKDEMATFPDE